MSNTISDWTDCMQIAVEPHTNLPIDWKLRATPELEGFLLAIESGLSDYNEVCKPFNKQYAQDRKDILLLEAELYARANPDQDEPSAQGSGPSVLPILAAAGIVAWATLS